MYYREVTGNLEEERQTIELWARTYPREALPHALLSAFACQGTGNFEESIEEAEKTLAIDPDFIYGYDTQAWSDIYLDRVGQAENVLSRGEARKVGASEFRGLRYFIAFMKGDQGAMDQAVAQARGESATEDEITHSEALVAARAGRLGLANTLANQAMAMAERKRQTESAAAYEAATAVWQSLYGNTMEARRDALTVLDRSRGRDAEFAAAFALARAGDLRRAQMLADDLSGRFPEDTSVKFTYMPVLRALSALGRGKPAAAVEDLQTLLPYELTVNGLVKNELFGGLYAAYVRGEAYLALGRGVEAGTEFQKTLDHPGIVLADPTGALAHLQLGRACALAGDTAKARKAYQDFLALWQDADSGIPILQQAKAEYARLQVSH